MPHFSKDIINVVGTFYTGVYSDPRLLELIQIGKEVILTREPANPHDTNAVGVYLLDEERRYGYIPRQIAARLSPILDRGSRYDCFVKEIRRKRSKPKIVVSLTTWPVPRYPPRQSMISIGHPSVPPPHPDTPTGERFRKIPDIESHFKRFTGFSGIYVIWNRDNKCYVGSSRDVGRRWKQHRNNLLGRCHENKSLQNDWVQLGAREFRFDLLEEVEPETLFEREAFFIRLLHSFTDGYNATPDGQRDPTIQTKSQCGSAPPELVISDDGTKPQVIKTPSPKSPEPKSLPPINIPPPEKQHALYLILGLLAFVTILVVAITLIPPLKADKELGLKSGKKSGVILPAPKQAPTEENQASRQIQIPRGQPHAFKPKEDQHTPTSHRQPQMKHERKESPREDEKKVRVMGDTRNYKSIMLHTSSDGSYLVTYYDKEGYKHVSNSREYLPAEIIEVMD